MGFNLNKAKEKKEEIANSFTPLELNEVNVQAIFNSCLKKENTREIETSILFPTALGYTPKDAVLIYFDKNILLSNNKNIEYIYGQLNSIHTEKNKKERLSISDFTTTYAGNIWSQNNAILLELLYLGCGKLTMPFSKQANDTTVLSQSIKPTLSPKDPAFPAWWAEHKAEWESPQ